MSRQLVAALEADDLPSANLLFQVAMMSDDVYKLQAGPVPLVPLV